MNRKMFIGWVLFFCFLVSGCTTLRYFDNSSNEEVQKFEMSKDQMWNEIGKLKQENQAYREMLISKNEEIHQLNIEVEELKKEMEELRAAVEQMEEERTEDLAKGEPQETTVVGQVAVIEEKHGGGEKADVRREASQATPVKEGDQKEQAVTEQQKSAVIKNLKVKVLSGTGKMSSARAMSQKLTKMGYMVAGVDMAPRKNFTSTTVYYAADYQKEAQNLAARLGPNAACKPLTWPSVFHIIVVSIE